MDDSYSETQGITEDDELEPPGLIPPEDTSSDDDSDDFQTSHGRAGFLKVPRQVAGTSTGPRRAGHGASGHGGATATRPPESSSSSQTAAAALRDAQVIDLTQDDSDSDDPNTVAASPGPTQLEAATASATRAPDQVASYRANLHGPGWRPPPRPTVTAIAATLSAVSRRSLLPTGRPPKFSHSIAARTAFYESKYESGMTLPWIPTGNSNNDTVTDVSVGSNLKPWPELEAGESTGSVRPSLKVARNSYSQSAASILQRRHPARPSPRSPASDGSITGSDCDFNDFNFHSSTTSSPRMETPVNLALLDPDFEKNSDARVTSASLSNFGARSGSPAARSGSPASVCSSGTKSSGSRGKAFAWNELFRNHSNQQTLALLSDKSLYTKMNVNRSKDGIVTHNYRCPNATRKQFRENPCKWKARLVEGERFAQQQGIHNPACLDGSIVPWGISPAAHALVDDAVSKGHRFQLQPQGPSAVLYKLIEERASNQVSGIAERERPVPTIQQLKNCMAYEARKEETATAITNLEELFELVELLNSKAGLEESERTEHTPYIIIQEGSGWDAKKKEASFDLLLTTDYLLDWAVPSEITTVVQDATYGIIAGTQDYAIILTGNVGPDRYFHDRMISISTHETQASFAFPLKTWKAHREKWGTQHELCPKYSVSDSAEAIGNANREVWRDNEGFRRLMDFPHVHRAILKKLKESQFGAVKKERDAFMASLYCLRRSWSDDCFDNAKELMIEKYSTITTWNFKKFNEEYLQTSKYFTTLRFWYCGAAPGCVVHSNSLEAKNRVLKEELKVTSGGRKLSFEDFLTNAMQYIRKASMFRDPIQRSGGDHIKMNTTPVYTRKKYERALTFIAQSKNPVFYFPLDQVWIILSSRITKGKATQESVQRLLNYYQQPELFEDFDGFAAFLEYIAVVKVDENANNLERLTCTCRICNVEFTCPHTIALAEQRMWADHGEHFIPENFAPLCNGKRKAGRPSEDPMAANQRYNKPAPRVIDEMLIVSCNQAFPGSSTSDPSLGGQTFTNGSIDLADTTEDDIDFSATEDGICLTALVHGEDENGQDEHGEATPQERRYDCAPNVPEEFDDFEVLMNWMLKFSPQPPSHACGVTVTEEAATITPGPFEDFM